MGQLQATLKSPAEALTTLKAALALVNPASNDTLQDQVLESLGRLYQEQQQYVEAIALSERRAKLAQARQDDQTYRLVVQELINLAIASGQSAQAQVWQQRIPKVSLVLIPPGPASAQFFSLPPLVRSYRETLPGGNGTQTPSPFVFTIPPPSPLPPVAPNLAPITLPLSLPLPPAAPNLDVVPIKLSPPSSFPPVTPNSTP